MRSTTPLEDNEAASTLMNLFTPGGQPVGKCFSFFSVSFVLAPPPMLLGRPCPAHVPVVLSIHHTSSRNHD